MTTVSYTVPMPTASFTFEGTTTTCNSGTLKSRTSSGTNRAKKKYVRAYWSFIDERVRTRVRAGKTIQWIVYKRRIRKYLVRNPELPKFDEPHPYNRSGISDESQPYLAIYSGLPLSGSYNNPTPAPNWVYQAVWTSNDDLVLLNKLRSTMNGSDFNAGVFLGEFPIACKMIGNAATRIYKAYKAFRSGRPISAWNHLTESKPYKKFGITQSSSWLELQYGWLPLLADAHDGAQFLAHHLSDVPQLKKFKAGRRITSVSKPLSSPGLQQYRKAEHFVHKSIRATVEETNLPLLSGLTDPLSVAWELLPYSFVIDWFIPIGNYLQARSFASSVKGTFVFSSLEKRNYGDFIRYNQSSGTRYVGGVRNYAQHVSSRSVSSSLDVKLPSFKPLAKVASWMHAANATALLTQKLRR